MSNNLLYQPGRQTSSGRFQITRAPRMEGHNYANRKSVAIIRWLVTLSSYYLFDPTSSLVFLPFGARWMVAALYHQDQKADPERLPAVSTTYFLKIWRSHKETARIRMRKHLRFALCDECVRLREAQDAARGQADAMAKVRKSVHNHRDFVRAQRRSYYKKRDMARDEPDTYLSLILDAADQVGLF